MKRRHSRRHLATGSVLLGIVLLSGCVTETSDSTPSPRSPIRAGTPTRPRGDPSTNPPALNLTPGGHTLTFDVRAVIGLIGTVPYDNFALPLVSPDGTFLATQTGISPTWSTTLARPSGNVPQATRVEIHRLDLGVYTDELQRARPARIASLAEASLLGRSSSPRGFLIESPRPDGTRRIGLASWTDGSIFWLVNDQYVNAFASLGADGRLAWSRRSIDGEHFDLVVRRGGDEFTLPAGDGDWLMPTWSGVGDGLFVMRLQDGMLDLAFVTASGAAAFRQSIVTTSMARNANTRTAYQALSGHVGLPDTFQPRINQLAYVHPSFARAAVWRPLEPGMVASTLLYERSFAVLTDDSDIAFVSTPRDLKRQSVVDPSIHANLLAGAQVPRRILSDNWHSILLSPQQGTISLTGLRLLPPER